MRFCIKSTNIYKYYTNTQYENLFRSLATTTNLMMEGLHTVSILLPTISLRIQLHEYVLFSTLHLLQCNSYIFIVFIPVIRSFLLNVIFMNSFRLTLYTRLDGREFIKIDFIRF